MKQVIHGGAGAGGEYARWLSNAPDTSRKPHARARTIDEAPSDPGEMPDYFASLTLEDLASAWPGCMVAMVAEGGGGAAMHSVARCCIVVAVRLHGWTPPPGWKADVGGLIMPSPATPLRSVNTPVTPVAPVGRAAPIGQPVGASNGPSSGASNGAVTPGNTAAAPARRVGEIDIFSGPPPIACGRREKFLLVMEAARALAPGQWMLWKKPPANYRHRVKAWASEWRVGLEAYKTASGDAVVKRPAA